MITATSTKLPAVKFDGKVVRRAEADGEMLFHADDCGRCVSICNIAKVCAELLAEHTRDIPGPHDKPHLYLTATGAAELSKLSKDYDGPKAFRAWLKQDFTKAPEETEEVKATRELAATLAALPAPTTRDAYCAFFALIANSPTLAPLWTVEFAGGSFDYERADRITGNLSSGEAVILNCLRSIWNGSADCETHRIDFTDLAAIDPTTRQPLIDWLINPFFP